MTAREQLGWRVPREERDAFVDYVEEKWGVAGPYVRFELESAMREFVDRDGELAEAERLLRGYLDARGLSSSTDAMPDRVDHSDTVQLGYRINAELKDEFTSWAKKHFSDSLGGVLARALNAYRDGGRGQRILDAVQTLVSGGTNSGTTDDAVENSASSWNQRGTTDGADENLNGVDESETASTGTNSGTTTASDENVSVDPQLVMEIGDALPDNGFPAKLLEAKTREIADDTDAAVDAYREPVADYKNVVVHPHNDDVYITEEKRAQTTLWCDLTRETRAARLRRLVVLDAFERGNQHHQIDYNRVSELFEEHLCAGPSHDYAYTLMEDAAEADGFTYRKIRGQKQLRVDVHKVRQEVVDDVLERFDYLDPKQLTVNGLVTGYSAGSSPPQQEGTAD